MTVTRMRAVIILAAMRIMTTVAVATIRILTKMTKMLTRKSDDKNNTENNKCMRMGAEKKC